jgi:hypothetical protein
LKRGTYGQISEYMITVTDLFIYPIKSCQRIRLEEAQVNSKGFAWDRELMLTDKKGKFITQRQNPNLATIKVEIIGDTFILTKTDNPPETFSFKPTLTGTQVPVEIWGDRTIGIDQGDEVASWFQKALQLDYCRLVRQSPQHRRPVDIQYAQTPNDIVSFADGYPFLLTTTASLRDLNKRLMAAYQDESQTVPMGRFRPNIVINTEEPFVEEYWQSIQIGEVRFALVKPCSRCVITTTDQTTGERNPLAEPLKTLSTFRLVKQKIFFGENMIPLNTGVIRVGDRILAYQSE